MKNKRWTRRMSEIKMEELNGNSKIPTDSHATLKKKKTLLLYRTTFSKYIYNNSWGAELFMIKDNHGSLREIRLGNKCWFFHPFQT